MEEDSHHTSWREIAAKKPSEIKNRREVDLTKKTTEVSKGHNAFQRLEQRATARRSQNLTEKSAQINKVMKALKK